MAYDQSEAIRVALNLCESESSGQRAIGKLLLMAAKEIEEMRKCAECKQPFYPKTLVCADCGSRLKRHD